MIFTHLTGAMKLITITATTLIDGWFQALEACYHNGREYKIDEGSYAGTKRRELDYITISFAHPCDRPLLPEVPPGFGIPDPVPGGIEWIRNEYLPLLMTDYRKENQQYTYGERLFGYTVDMRYEKAGDLKGKMLWDIRGNQVDEVISKFKRGYGNNQACMTIAKPSDIHLPDPPCLRQIDCRIFSNEEKPALHMFVYFRSWDLWGGFPANLAAIVYLLEYMANEIGVEPGQIVAASKGLHLYDMYWKVAATRLNEKLEKQDKE